MTSSNENPFAKIPPDLSTIIKYPFKNLNQRHINTLRLLNVAIIT